MKPTLRSALVCAGAVAAVTAGTLPASAAPSYDGNPAGYGQTVQPFHCEGLGDLMIRTNSNNSSDMGGWSAAKIVAGGSGTLIPTSFRFEAFDVTLNRDLFPAGSQVKGGGNANGQQGPVVDCSQSTTAELADFLEPGDEVPPGAALTDTVTVTLSATAILVP